MPYCSYLSGTYEWVLLWTGKRIFVTFIIGNMSYPHTWGISYLRLCISIQALTAFKELTFIESAVARNIATSVCQFVITLSTIIFKIEEYMSKVCWFNFFFNTVHKHATK